MGSWNTADYPEDRLADDSAGVMPFDTEEGAARRVLRPESSLPRGMTPAWWLGPGAIAPAAAAPMAREAAPPAKATDTTPTGAAPTAAAKTPAWFVPYAPSVARPPRAGAMAPDDESPEQQRARIAQARARFEPLVAERRAARMGLGEYGSAPEIYQRAIDNLTHAAARDPAAQQRLDYVQKAAAGWHARNPGYRDARTRVEDVETQIRELARAQAARRTPSPGLGGNLPLPASTFPLPTSAGAPGNRGLPGAQGAPGESERPLGQKFREQVANKPPTPSSGFSLYPISAARNSEPGTVWGDVFPSDRGAQIATNDGLTGELLSVDGSEVIIRAEDGKEYPVQRQDVRITKGKIRILTPTEVEKQFGIIQEAPNAGEPQENRIDPPPIPPLEPETNDQGSSPVQPPPRLTFGPVRGNELPSEPLPEIEPPSPPAATPPAPPPPRPTPPVPSPLPTPYGNELPNIENLPPLSPPAPKEPAPDTGLLPNFAAETAKLGLEKASGTVRWWNGPLPTEEELKRQWEDTHKPNTIQHNGRTYTVNEFTQHMDLLIDGARRAADSLPQREKDDWAWRNAQHRVRRLEETKRQGLRQTDPEVRRAEFERTKAATIQSWHEHHDAASQLSAGASHSYEYFGANPDSTNPGARIGRAGAAGLHKLPSRYPWAAPIGAGAEAAQTYGQAYDQTAQTLRDAGVRDEREIDRHAREAAGRAVLHEQIVAHANKKKVVPRPTGPQEPPPRPDKPSGRDASVEIPFGDFIENPPPVFPVNALTTETLTSEALRAILDSHGVWSRASSATRQRAQTELNRRAQIYTDASPRERRVALVKTLSELPDTERALFHLANAKKQDGQPRTHAEAELLKKVTRNAAEHLALRPSGTPRPVRPAWAKPPTSAGSSDAQAPDRPPGDGSRLSDTPGFRDALQRAEAAHGPEVRAKMARVFDGLGDEAIRSLKNASPADLNEALANMAKVVKNGIAPEAVTKALDNSHLYGTQYKRTHLLNDMGTLAKVKGLPDLVAMLNSKNTSSKGFRYELEGGAWLARNGYEVFALSKRVSVVLEEGQKAKKTDIDVVVRVDDVEVFYQFKRSKEALRTPQDVQLWLDKILKDMKQPDYSRVKYVLPNGRGDLTEPVRRLLENAGVETIAVPHLD